MLSPRQHGVLLCHPVEGTTGKIRTRLSTSSYQRRFGLGTRAAWMSRRVECDHCGQELAASSLASHLETQHGVFQAQVVDPEYLEDRPAWTYEAHESADGIYRCPVPDCEGEARQKWGLRRHFRDRHPLDMVYTPGEGVFPKCENCGMQTSELAFDRGHLGTRLCLEVGERRHRHQAAADAVLALWRQFTADGNVLERVEVFKYLGRLLDMSDDDLLG